jgi:hypothetical protein
MRQPFQANTLYFFQIVKEPNSLRLKSPEPSKPQLARFRTLLGDPIRFAQDSDFLPFQTTKR